MLAVRVMVVVAFGSGSITPSYAQGPIPLTGTIRAGAGGARFSGSIRFRLPVAGAIDTSCSPSPCLLTPTTKTWPVFNGQLPSYAKLVPNSPYISPANTFYEVYLIDTFGSLVQTYNLVITAPVMGAYTFDIGNATPTTITSNNISFVSPANLTGNNTFTGNNNFIGTNIFTNTTTLGPSVFSSSINQTNSGSTISFAATVNHLGVSTFNAKPVFNIGVDPNGTGVKILRAAVGCTTAASVGAVCTSSAQTWGGSAWADANYNLLCTLSNPTGVPVVSSVSRTTTTFTITVAALTAVAATGDYNCVGVHN